MARQEIHKQTWNIRYSTHNEDDENNFRITTNIIKMRISIYSYGHDK